MKVEFCLGLLQRLDDLAGHRADIGPPVSPDLALVAHPAEADADELAPRGVRHRLPERGLAHARRADEAHDRPLQLLRALLHRQILDDPLLDLLEPEVVVVEHLLRPAQILPDARAGAPRDRQEPVEVVAHHRRLGAHRAHRLQFLDLGLGLLARFFRELGLGDALLQLGHLVLALLAVAQLALDRLHLLVQVIFALRALHLRLDAGLDLLLDLQDRHLALHVAIDLLEPLLDRERFQKLLLLAHVDAQMARNKVGELRGLARFRDLGDGFLGDVLPDLGVALELLAHCADKGGHCVGLAGEFRQPLAGGFEIARVVVVFGDAHAAPALDQHLDGPVGQLEELQHVREHADLVDAVRSRLIHGMVDLAREQDLLVVLHHFLECADRFLPADEQRHDHVRKHHDLAQRQDGVGRVQRF